MSTADAGTFMMVLAAGSCIGGVVVSIRPVRTSRPLAVGGLLFCAFGLCIVPSALAPNVVVFGITLAITSVALVPLNGLGMAELEKRVRIGERAEAFGIIMACTQVGGGISGLLGGFGASVMKPWQLSLVSAGLFGAVGVWLIASGSRRGLRNLGECGALSRDGVAGPVASGRSLRRSPTGSGPTIVERVPPA